MGLFEIEVEIKIGPPGIPHPTNWRESVTVIEDSAFLANMVAIEKIAARLNIDTFDLSIIRTTAV